MVDVCLNYAPAPWRNDLKLRHELIGEILSLNGKPSIFQIDRFCERLVVAGELRPVQTLLDEYLNTLRQMVAGRLPLALHDSNAYLIHGTREMLTLFRDRGCKLFVLSGTLQSDVEKEAEWLGLREFFGERIYGASASTAFSKMDVINRIICQEGIKGRQLVAFGDGPVEIEFTKAVGGLAIGVASDEEANDKHRVDPIKRELLIAAGADAIIPDYVNADHLVRLLLG
jgi:phosphoglycolate phosphatase-like HAD superfamily hydrolase